MKKISLIGLIGLLNYNIANANENWETAEIPPDVNLTETESGLKKFIDYYDGLTDLRLLDNGQIEVKRSTIDGKVSFDEYILFLKSERELVDKTNKFFSEDKYKTIAKFGISVENAASANFFRLIKRDLFDPLDKNHDQYISLEDQN